jgi:hypothetical protein
MASKAARNRGKQAAQVVRTVGKAHGVDRKAIRKAAKQAKGRHTG